MYPAKNKDVEGSYHNGLPDGRFTVYNRNPYYSNGIMLTAPTRAGYITYKNGVKVSMENDAETPLLKDESLSQPVCTYCNGAGIIGSGKYFMGREIPNRCPRCGGTGYTWLNPK